MKIGITGGIGSGKTYVCKRLNKLGIEIYDCDKAAKRLIRTSPVIREQLKRLVGDDAYNGEELNKAAIATFLLTSEAHAKAIDDIVHPAVFRDFEESGMQWMESAIIYESGMWQMVDRIIAVTAPKEVRIGRVMQRDGITRERTLEWLAKQLPQDEVLARSDYEIVNDGEADIRKQIDSIVKQINRSNHKQVK